MTKYKKAFTIPMILLVITVGTYFFASDGIFPTGSATSEENMQEINNAGKNAVLKFESMPITYALNIDTSQYVSEGIRGANDEKEKEKIRQAFKIIEESSDNTVQFREVNESENPNILVYGFPPKEAGINDRFIIEGRAGPTETQGNKILGAEITLYPSKTEGYAEQKNYFEKEGVLWETTEYNLVESLSWEANACKEIPQTEIHEILHALGIGHVYDNSYSVMAPIKHKIQTCKVGEIDPEIASCLKYIYSNGELGESCDGINLYPWEEENIDEKEDFKWDNLPVTYSVSGCNERQKQNLQKGERMLEKQTGYNLYEINDYGESQVNFYCKDSFDNVLLNEETDFWDTTVYFPAAQPYFDFKDGKINKARILLFGQDRNCGGIEMHELLHGLGLRNHYGPWTEYETELCDTNVMVVDRNSINKIKEIYGLSS